ncbi:MAG: FAD-dependent oxidoreductase [Methanoregula sp.]
MTIAILGGGLSGLALARLLHEKGNDVVVLETETTYGGLCRSKNEQGYTFDIGGSHIIFSRDTEVLAFMRRMIERNEQRNERNTKIFYKDQYVKYPFENGLSDLPMQDRFFCINEFVKTHVAVEKGELPAPKNFREWIYYTFGKGIAECYMVPYNEKIWKYPTDHMSMHWVDGRIPRPPVEDVIKSAIGISTEGYTHQSIFSYPLDGGIEALVSAIAEPIQDKIRIGFRVTSVRKKGDVFEISNGHEIILADQCISTIPVQHLIAALDNVPAVVKKASSALRYNALVCVNIGIQGAVPDISWLYIPEIALGMTNRISFPSNYSNHAAPGGCGSVLAEITHQPGDEVSRMGDAVLIDQVVKTLEAMHILKKEQIIYSSVERQPYAYVVYDLDYQKNIAIVKDHCTSACIPLVGRFSQFEYLNMDGCLRSVMDFVARFPNS